MDTRNLNKSLIKYIYDTIDISRFKYEILKNTTQLPLLISTTYFISPNYSGKNCFLVFTKIKQRFYSFMVDKRQLSYTFEKVSIENVFISHCNVNTDINIYNGTILDGIFIRRNEMNEFLVTDVYYLKGIDYTNTNLNHKLLELNVYLENMNPQLIREKINSKINIELKVNKVHKLETIKSFVENGMNEYKNYSIKGICFYPNISSTKLIYMYPNEQDNKIQKKYPNEQDNKTQRKYEPVYKPKENITKSRNIVKKVFVAKSDTPIYAILEMQPTKTADNYKLYALEKINEQKVRYKKCQMDIAYIPNMQKSQWCRDITMASHTGYVFVKCIWRDNKKKWEPLEVVSNIKLPTLIDDIRKDIIELEKSDSESEEL